MRKSIPEQAAMLRDRADLSLSALANAMGYSGPSSIQRYFKDTDFRGEWLPMDFAIKLATALKGLGRPPITEHEVLLLAGPAYTQTINHRIPVISYVQAGGWTEAVDAYEKGNGFDYITADSDVGPNAFALEVKGPSMLTRFHEGDRGIFDPDVEPIPGDFVVAKRDGDEEATFKQYRPRGFDAKKRPIIDLTPLNEVWPILRIDAENPGQIIATLVEHHSYRKQ